MDIKTSLYTGKLAGLTRIETDKDPETLDMLFMGVLRENWVKPFSAEYER